MAGETIGFYWKKTCSTCRGARDALTQAGFTLEEREYSKQPLTEAELRHVLDGRLPSEIFNWGSVAVRAMNLRPRRAELSEDELLALMVKEPNLIKRPLIVVGKDLVAGFDKVARPKLSELLGRPL